MAPSQAFRAEWARTQYTERVKERRHTRSYHDIDEEIGEYLPLGAIVQKLGGWRDQSAVAGAKRYCQCCTEMAGKWCSYNDMTQLMDFLFVTRKFKHIMEEKWSLYVRETEKPKRPAVEAAARPATPAAPAVAAATPTAAADPTPVPSPVSAAALPYQPPQKPSTKSKAKGKAKGGAAAGTTAAGTAAAAAEPAALANDDKDIAKKVCTSIRKATSINNQFLQLTAQCEELNKDIDANDSWIWASSPVLQGKLQSSMEKVREAITDFARSCLYKDIKVVRSESESAHKLLTYLDRLVQIDNPLQKLQGD